VQLALLGDAPAVIAFLVVVVNVQGSQTSGAVWTATLRMPRVHAVETATLNAPLYMSHAHSNPIKSSTPAAVDDRRMLEYRCTYNVVKLTLSA
jgi:hypothetical protein